MGQHADDALDDIFDDLDRVDYEDDHEYDHEYSPFWGHGFNENLDYAEMPGDGYIFLEGMDDEDLL